ncbi:PAS and ANTAR domain-containing protein [Mycobacterium sherrisii]|uniref:histidine kinase n=1 Tax=Mycobacterium sherrisii TaxID=243061 RepID=A0A1E3STC8_9MYCO|nr:PAS and ANTAR domain-containing protein [Mycobacterium sherrisii]MCV7032486.1 ANTAR domain-containing protein [Mycobacterium sherrisii]ODR05349.1 antitermination regulator [Mycobacterium sherrisii]ORW73275.1 antitermination regulator [Mycobacterium sherrisii]
MTGSAAESAPDGIAPERVGWFRFYFDDQSWEWSPEVERLHGYNPGTVTPTTELVLSHKHPEDRDKVAATINDITQTHGVFSGRHRIIDTAGQVHAVLVVGDQFCDDDGIVVGTHGFYVDVTPSEQIREDMVTERLADIAHHRSIIEQAKGMLMLIYDIDEDAAFGLLAWLSQKSNIKLRALAEGLVPRLRAVSANAISDKVKFDHALMTTPEHVAGG